MLDSNILSEKSDIPNRNSTSQLWKLNDQKANKQGIHSKVYWVKEQNRQEDGTFLRVRWKINNCYQGNWKDNKKCGFGIQTYDNGDKYEGEWFDNKKHGYGTYWVKNEKKKLVRSYTGQFLADHKNGKGTMYFSNGDRYDGYWEEDQMSGFGRMVYANGDVYVGHWASNQRNGYGVFTKNNGDYYEGNWLMNNREGYGSFYFAETQKVIIGEWVNDSPKVSVLYKAEKEAGAHGDESESQRKQKNQFLEEVNMMKNQGEKLKVESSLLPPLELDDPITLLEEAMNEVRAERLVFRIKNSPIECLVNEEELTNLFENFEILSDKSLSLNIEQLTQFVEADSQEMIQTAIDKLELDEGPYSFEDSVKVMLILENLTRQQNTDNVIS